MASKQPDISLRPLASSDNVSSRADAESSVGTPANVNRPTRSSYIFDSRKELDHPDRLCFEELKNETSLSFKNLFFFGCFAQAAGRNNIFS